MRKKISITSIFIGILLMIMIFAGVSRFYYFGSDKFSFHFEERFTNQFDGTHLFLSVETEEIFPCGNYIIEHSADTDLKTNTTKVFLGRSVKPDLECYYSIEPAHMSMNLGFDEGVYMLELHWKNHVDKYVVTRSQEKVVIESLRDRFTRLKEEEISRPPIDLLEVDCNIGSRLDPKEGHCENLFLEIEKIAHPHFVAEEGRVPMNQFYLYSGDDKALSDLIQKYDREGFYVRITTGKGKAFSCSPYCEDPGVGTVPKLEIQYRSN